MNVKYSFVCDAANIANSGNLNVLGIFRNINAMNFPHIHAKFMYIAHIEFHRSEICVHKFKLSFVNDDGIEILPPINGEINVHPEAPWANIILELVNVKFPTPGTYQIDLAIDNHHTITDSIKVVMINQNNL